jgi:L-lysine exporter family protein LysE/ArgO
MDGFCVAPFMEGCGTGAGLIIAIGAQNAFVLKQGILKNYVLLTVLMCAFTDAVLILLGVGGFGAILTSNKLLLSLAKWGGVAFLAYYGFRSFKAVFFTQKLELNEGFERPNLKTTILTTLAVCLLNPHVYLDTVVLLGSIGAQFPAHERSFFAIGAMSMSFVWFFALGYGARYLAPLFQKPIAWKILDFIIGCIMWAIALSLILWTQDCACPTL